MWSLGSTFAEFFTSLKLCDEYEEDEEYPPTAETDNKVPFFIPEGLRIGQPGTKWARDTLFDGMRGEIGLAWSIFKIMGTPTEQTWPVSDYIYYRVLTLTKMPDIQGTARRLEDRFHCCPVCPAIALAT